MILLGAIVGAGGSAWWTMIRMPGNSYLAPLPPLTEGEARLAEALHRDVLSLATFGDRNVVNQRNLKRAASWLESLFSKTGYQVTRQGYQLANRRYDNIIAELKGSDRANEIIVSAYTVTRLRTWTFKAP